MQEEWKEMYQIQVEGLQKIELTVAGMDTVGFYDFMGGHFTPETEEERSAPPSKEG